MTDVGIAEERVVAATGHGRDHWYAILDRLGDVGHAARAKHLATLDVAGWWCQMLAVDYERARGLREVGQACTGDFQVSCSKTYAMGADDVWRALTSAEILGDAAHDWTTGATWESSVGRVEVRRADPCKMLRFWLHADDRSTVEISFPKIAEKTTMTIAHSGLTNAEEVEHYRGIWKNALAALV